MEKILTENTYDIPSLVKRTIDLGVIDHNGIPPVYVRITHPPGFEKNRLVANVSGKSTTVFIPKRLSGQNLYPLRITLRIFQIVKDEVEIKPPPIVVETPRETAPLNPEPVAVEKEKTFVGKFFSGSVRPKDWKADAVEKTRKRNERLTRSRQEVYESAALKPAGHDKKYILTADDCGYSRGMSLIENIKVIQEKHNIQSGLTKQSEQRLLCEFVDVLSFSGIGVIVGLYLALGTKSKGQGNLDY